MVSGRGRKTRAGLHDNLWPCTNPEIKIATLGRCHGITQNPEAADQSLTRLLSLIASVQINRIPFPQKWLVPNHGMSQTLLRPSMHDSALLGTDITFSSKIFSP